MIGLWRMSFTVIFHPDAAKDIARLNTDLKQRIVTAITELPYDEPALYANRSGQRSRDTGWCARDYRMVFANGSEIIVLAGLPPKRSMT